MISIIICSKNAVLDGTLLENIRETVGVDYEIVHIDNSKGEYGICGAYNIGVRQSQGDILCFMHEDILYHSHDWGKAVEKHMETNHIGMLGVAGALTVSEKYDWRFYGFITHLLQGYQTLTNPPYYYIKGIEWDTNEPLRRVAIVDGCWFCIKRELFTRDILKFDEKTFPSFHLYDSDMSMQVNMAGLDIYICADIVLEHFSEGMYTPEFQQGLADFLKKWKDHLPLSVENVHTDTFKEINNDAELRLAARLERDRLIKIIRTYYANGANMKKLPQEAMTLIEASMVQYVKAKIKFSKTNKEAWEALRRYLDMPKHSHAWNLRWKYFYYRFINRRHIKNIVSVQSLNQ